MPRFMVSLNIEKIVQHDPRVPDVPFLGPQENPGPKAIPWRNLCNVSMEVPGERRAVQRGCTVANEAPSTGTPTAPAQLPPCTCDTILSSLPLTNAEVLELPQESSLQALKEGLPYGK